MTTTSIITDTIFTFLVVLLMFSMKKPEKGKLKSVFHNLTFWVFVGFWLKTLSTVLRLPLLYLHPVRPEYITIWFNWGGSLIVTISSVVPFQWVFHFARLPPGSFVQLPTHDRLWFCVGVVGVYIVALITTVFCLGFEVVTPVEVLFVWRVFFFLNAGIEAVLLTWCLVLIRRSDRTRREEDRWSKLRLHLWTTIYMRGGISGTIVLKFFQVLPEDKLGSIHLFFILTGLFAYRLRTISTSKSDGRHFTEQILVFEDRKRDDSAIVLFEMIAQRIAMEDGKRAEVITGDLRYSFHTIQGALVDPQLEDELATPLETARSVSVC
jgi:hypothetical protein